MVIQSLAYFVLAGLCEIGGGYLIWLWLREEKGEAVAIAGGVVLLLYGVIPTLQPANFGRVYAAYGGVFVGLSLLWGWWVDGLRPDSWDWLGSGLAILGVLMMMFAPRQ